MKRARDEALDARLLLSVDANMSAAAALKAENMPVALPPLADHAPAPPPPPPPPPPSPLPPPSPRGAALFYGSRSALPAADDASSRTDKWLRDLSLRASAAAAAGAPALLRDDFATQAEAFAAGDDFEAASLGSPSPPHRVVYFSREDVSSNGRRRFGCCAPAGALWRELLRTPPGSRHVYELLREGRPVRLYFDCEFSADAIEGDPAVLGPRAVAALRSLLADWLPGCGLTRGAGVERVVELDSSTDAKARFAWVVVASLSRFWGKYFP